MSNPIMVGVKLTPVQHAKWKELGGAKWLREHICKEIENDRAKEMGRVLYPQPPAPVKKPNTELIASLEKILEDAKAKMRKAVA